jgi:hypothetical protein
LPERYRWTKPGLAVGLMFVPIFNFFWAFVSFPKLARGFNEWRANLPELPIRNVRTLGIWRAVLFVGFFAIGWIPLFGGLVCIADALIFAFYYRGIVHNANLAIKPSLLRAGL